MVVLQYASLSDVIIITIFHSISSFLNLVHRPSIHISPPLSTSYLPFTNFLQESEIVELEEVINSLKEQQKTLEAESLEFRNKKVECFRRSEKCEKRVDQVSAKVVALQVLVVY